MARSAATKTGANAERSEEFESEMIQLPPQIRQPDDKSEAESYGENGVETDAA